ncbi:hypothetical protein AB0I28_34480 [Phytomonospora sp. NPDC050363]|uniref:hypothetical protein n=1 Tax=Phytomonospora sp. NPDC050363 TaxID=3155642 RepID=UPI0033D5087B
MTEDLKIMLDHASEQSPPHALDTDTVVKRGRNRVRRRGLALVGGAALSVAAVTAVSVAVASSLPTAPKAEETPPVAAAEPPPDYTLPDLDPDGRFEWNSAERTDDATGAQLTAALTAYFAGHHPEAKVARWGPEKTDVNGNNFSYVRNLAELTEPQSTFQVSRYTNQLIDAEVELDLENPDLESRVVYTAPVYRLWNGGELRTDVDTGATIGRATGAPIAFDGEGADQLDDLQVALFPPGGYRTGHDATKDSIGDPGNGHLVEGCDDHDVKGHHGGPGTEVTYRCDELAGPNGERITTVAARETYKQDGTTLALNTVVVIRTDGTALVVTDSPTTGMEWTQGSGDGPGGPALDLDELTELALAVPLVSF